MDLEIIQHSCSHCGKLIETNWFARISEGDNWMFFCSPECVLSHVENTLPISWEDRNLIRNSQVFSMLCNG
jgi:hypothetical protein